MRLGKFIGSFIWHTHIYFFVLALLVWLPHDTNQLYGYLAMFIASSYTIFLLLFILHATFHKFELFLPQIFYVWFGWLLVGFFYISERTDLYWLGVYAAVAAAAETIRHLFKKSDTLEGSHNNTLTKYLLASYLAIGFWFFIVDFLPNVTEYTLLITILLLYLIVGIIVQGSVALERNNFITSKTFHLVILVVSNLAIIIMSIGLLVSYLMSTGSI